MPDVFELEHVSCAWAGVSLLSDVNLSLRRGEMLVIAGGSGHGKSMLLEVCAGMRRPGAGVVKWDGIDIRSLTHDQIQRWRRRIGYVFQQHALISNLFLFDNIALPLRYHHEMAETEIRARVRAVLDECGLFNIDRRFPDALSFGQQRRAALARAMVTDPDILFLDEPTEGLDPLAEEGTFNVLRAMQQQKAVSIVMVTNALRQVSRFKARTFVLESGTLYNMDALPPGALANNPFVSIAATLLKKEPQ